MNDPQLDEAGLREWLVTRIATATGVERATVDPDHPLDELGLSSRDAVAMVGELERLLGRSLSPTLVWEHPTITLLAAGLLAGPADGTAAPVRQLPNRSVDEPIAIVGLGCRMPGGADSAAAFWELLAAGRDGVREVPDGRWEEFSDGSAQDEAVLARTTRHGGFLGDVSGFDAEFFGITPREADLMDPQQRLLLEVAWEALEHAGLPAAGLRGTATGVFVGVSGTEYSHLTGADLDRIDAWTATGSALSIVANRLSYLLDLRGPSVAMDTACSSSLVAVHQAVQSLRSGESDTALAGGVNLLLSPSVTVTFDEAGALAPDGRCKAFDAAADGIARGEGCGVVVLKRLSDARRDGDRVLALIRGSGVNSDGRSNGLTAPNPASQEALLRSVYGLSGLAPTEIDYVEAHGTGTLLGDPIEARALGASLGAGRDAARPLLIGSVKTNLGHLEAAAGIAGLIKVVLAMSHNKIPASLHFAKPNPHIPFEASKLRVAAEPTAWPRYGGVARAGVSAFGFGGTNAHVIVEEWPQTPPPRARRGATEPATTVLISGQNPERIRLTAAALTGWLEDPANARVTAAEVAATMGRHRNRGKLVGAVVSRGREAMVEGLRSLADGQEWPGVVTGPARPARPPRGPVLVFSGYGSHWAGMGQRLLAEEPAFAAAVDEVDPLIAAEAGFSLKALIKAGEKPRDLAVIQIATFGIQYALARTWRRYGVEPAAVIGHSMGEITAAVVAGALSVTDGVRVITLRSKLMVEAARRLMTAGRDIGGMALVEMTAEEIDAVTDRFPGLGVAVYASPTQCTVAGDTAQLAELVAHVEGLGRTARVIDVKGAAHSPLIDIILDDFVSGLAGLTAQPPTVPVYGTVLEDPHTTPAFDPEYWGANVRHSVRFTQAVAAAAADGYTTFVEVSPHPVATVAVSQTLTAVGNTGTEPVVAWTLRRDTDDVVTFRTNLATLHVNSQPSDLDATVQPGRLVDAPTTPWKHQRYWVAAPSRRNPRPVGHPLLGTHVELPPAPGPISTAPEQHVWHADLGTGALPWLADHRVRGTAVLPGAAWAEIALAAGATALRTPADRVTVSDVELYQVLVLGDQTEATTALTVTGQGTASVTLWTRSATGAWVRNATARLAVSDADRPAAPPAGASTVGVDFYTRFPIAAQAYGPAFRGIVTAGHPADLPAGSTEGRATAEVALPAAAGPAADYHVHPALLDSAMQTLGVAALSVLDGGSTDTSDLVYLPMGIGSLRVLGPLDGPLRCEAVVRAADGDAAGALGTVELIGPDDAVVLQARDVYLRRAVTASVPVPLGEKLFEAGWVPAPLPAVEESRTPGRWLVLAAGHGPATGGGEQLVAGLTAAGDEVVFGGLEDPATITATMDEMRAAHGGPPWSGVVVVAPDLRLDAYGFDAATEGAQQLILSVSEVARQLLDGTVTPSRLYLTTRGAATIDGEAGEPGLSSLRALVRVLGMEHTDLHATLVDVDRPAGSDSGASDAALVAELRAGAPHTEVAWRDGKRYEAQLHRVRAEELAAPADRPPLVRPGAYLITGGTGGLGLLLARWLADRGARRLVLNGRREVVTDAVQATLDELRSGGVEIEVVGGNLAEPGIADRMVAAAVAGGLPLHGVAHLAGGLADQVVIGLDRASLEHTWAPKVAGAWRLHEAVGDERDRALDWWLGYSSAAGLLGSPGQASYATSNAWLDAYIEWRRANGRPGVSIQWGAWAEVGGAKDNDNVLLEGLTPDEGMEALEAVLGSGRAVTGVIRLNIPQIVQLFPNVLALPYFAALHAEAGEQESVAGPDWVGVEGLRAADPVTARQLLVDRLLSRVGGIMGFRPGDLDRRAPLTDLGLDSLMAVRAKNAVEADFGVPLPVRTLLQGATVDDFVDYLAGELGITLAADDGPQGKVLIAGRDHTERLLRALWEDVLGRDDVSVDDDFYALGGDPAAAEKIAELVAVRVGYPFTVATLFATPTIEAQADVVRPQYESAANPVRVLKPEGDQPPLFLAHPAGGPASVYQELATLLSPGQPVYGLERIDELRTIEAKAARYIELIKEVQPRGPYRLGGWSLGGCVAYEMGRQLRAAGETVDLVAMIDTVMPLPPEGNRTEQELVADRLMVFIEYLKDTYGVEVEVPYDELFALDDLAQADLILKMMVDAGMGMSKGILQHQRDSYLDLRVAERYQIGPYDGRVVLYRATEAADVIAAQDPRYQRSDESLGWDEWCSDLESLPVPGDHLSLIDRPNLDVLANHLDGLLTELSARRS